MSKEKPAKPADKSPAPEQDETAKAIAAARERLANHKNAPDDRQDGPTIEQFVAAGYSAQHYPPKGYAVKDSQGLIEFVAEGKISEATLGIGLKELQAKRAERDAAERAAKPAEAKPADAGTVPPKPVNDSSVAPKPKACDHTSRCEAHKVDQLGGKSDEKPKQAWTCTRKGCPLEGKYETVA